MVETYPQQRMNGTSFTALVNPLGDALGEVEPRFGDVRVDNKSDVAKRVEALSCDVAVLRCPGIAAFGRDISRGATSEELHLWSRLGYARGHVYGTSVLEPKASAVLEPEAIEDT